MVVHLEPVSGMFSDTGHLPQIYIDPRQSDAECFRTAFHEWLHAKFPNLSESQVEQAEAEFCSGLALRLFTVQKKDGAW